MYYIYLLEFQNNKKYIGITQDYNRRIGQHRRALLGGYHDNKEWQQEFNDKIINENFNYKLLETHEDREIAHSRERELIEYHNSIQNGYNKAFGGLTNEGYKQSDYAKQVASKIHSQKIGEDNSFYGKTHTQETKDIISKKVSLALKGKEKSEEHKRKLSLNNARAKVVIIDGTEYHSLTEAERVTGISRKTISKQARDENIKNIYFK